MATTSDTANKTDKPPHAYSQSMTLTEHLDLQEKINKKQEKQKYAKSKSDLHCMGRQMSVIRGLITDNEFSRMTSISEDSTLIRKLTLIVVVDAEIRPIMDKYKFDINEELTAKFLNLGVVSSGKVKNLNIDIIKVAESKIFKRHYSGYTQASALAALVSSIIKPDIVISFGTAGGITKISRDEYNLHSPRAGQTDDTKQADKGDKGYKYGAADDDNKEKEVNIEDEEYDDYDSDFDDGVDSVEIGDVVLGEACLFLDRLRTRNKNAFDWGLWGGSSVKTSNLSKDLGLVKGVVGSQIGYMITGFQSELIGNANIIALDMECAPIAQILNQTGVYFLALKVISNGIYPGNPEKMESEYHDNREMVSKKATEILVKVIDYLNDKKINEL